MVINDKFDRRYRVSLYPGDCLDFLKTIPDKTIQLIITSPPYNIGKRYEKRLDFKNYLNNLEKVINECYRILKDEGSICWQVGNYVENGYIIPLDVLLYESFISRGMKMRNRIIWHFGHGLHCSKRFSGRYETINWFTKSDVYVFNLDAVRIPQIYPGKKYFKGKNRGEYSANPLGKNPTDVWHIPNVKANHVEKTIHPCQFPVALVQRLILSLSKQNDIIFDPFMGVGTTAIAALINRRKVAGAEINKDYYKVSVKRIQQVFTGTFRYREDKPIYVPDKNCKLTVNPFNVRG